MRVLYFYQYFNTRDGYAATRAYEFARHLVDRGDEVSMVTGESEHAGEEGQRGVRLIDEEFVDGIRVIRIGVPYSQSLGSFARMLSFGQFAGLASLLIPRLPKPDLVFATSTPLTVGVPGLLASRWFRVPFVFEVRDLWPEVPIGLGFLSNRCVIRVAEVLERLLYRKASSLIALSPGMERGMVAQGARAERITVIPNMADLGLFSEKIARTPWRSTVGIADDAFVVVHLGAMGFVNDLGQVLDAAAMARDDRVVFALVGTGSEREELEARAAREGLRNVVFAGPYQRREMPWVLSGCDAGLLCVRANPVLFHNSANKFGDYLAAGLPVIVTYPGWHAELLRAYSAGFAAEGTVDLLEVIERMRTGRVSLASLREGALRLARERFSREEAVRQFEQVLDAAGGGARGGAL